MPFDPKHYTDRNKSLVELIRKNLFNYDNDTKQTTRIKLQQCKYCYYISNKISLQAFTIFICKNCNDEIIHHNSNVDKYCMDCAKELNICCHCGAEMDWYYVGY